MKQLIKRITNLFVDITISLHPCRCKLYSVPTGHLLPGSVKGPSNPALLSSSEPRQYLKNRKTRTLRSRTDIAVCSAMVLKRKNFDAESRKGDKTNRIRRKRSQLADWWWRLELLEPMEPLDAGASGEKYFPHLARPEKAELVNLNLPCSYRF